MNTLNRLQFRHHGIGSGYTIVDGVFDTREEAIEYIYSEAKYATEGLASVDVSYGLSLFGEPTVLRYKNEENEDDPHLILAIGSVTNDDEGKRETKNRFCIIDIDKTESEIADIYEKIEELINAFGIVAKNSDTLNLYSEKTESGTVISGDVRVAEYRLFDRIRQDNAIMSTEDGLFMFVGASYDDNTGTFTFTVNDTTETFTINGNQIVSGVYKPEDESLHIRTKYGDEVTINLEDLIAEWVVEGEAAKSPIVLTRTEVGHGNESQHSHVEPWQDILSADVRISTEHENNILKKTNDNCYLYVDGEASNIVYYSRSGKTNVKEMLDELSTIGLSTDDDNIVTTKADGFFASTKLEYVTNENTLIFTTSTNDGENRNKETRIKLNSFKLFDEIYYDDATETLVILYTDGNGEQQRVEVPIGEMMDNWEWEPYNEGHNVAIDKVRVVHGTDKVSADVKILNADDNILVDRNHLLYVKGTADNIKYGRNSNVSDEIDSLKSEDGIINGKISDIEDNINSLANELRGETERAINEDERIDNKLDSEIERSTNIDAALGNKIDIETSRAESAETALDAKIVQEAANREADVNEEEARALTAEAELNTKIEQEAANREADVNTEESRALAAEAELTGKIGSGFTNDPHDNVTYKFEQLKNRVELEADKLQGEINRSTAKDDEHDDRFNTIDGEISTLQSEINVVSGDSANSLKDVNSDASINVDKTNPIVPNIKVNISKEVEEGRRNIIKLNADGLFANVDLDYVQEANKLVFHKTDGTPDKEIQLESVSSIINIEYNPSKEAIVITYLTNGHEVKTVEIPVSDLIDEWRVEDGHPNAIQLEKVRAASGTSEQDVLKASVVITDSHDDNILVLDGGALYVSGSDIEQNKQDISNINARVALAEDNVASLDTALEDEIERATRREAEIETALETSAASLSNRIDEVDAKTFTLTVDDTPTVDLTLDNDKKLSANVLLANGTTNIIKASSNTADGSGLFAAVDLEYNAATNKLKLITSAAEKEIALSMGSIIKSIEYDSVGKNLIIRYDVNTAGSIHEETVYVPVEDLFNDWTVQEGEHLGAIILHKEEGVGSNPDILSAEIVISTLQDNMIVNDQGSLYVSKEPINAISGALDTLREDFEESLAVEDSMTLHLERDRSNILKGDVKVSSDESNLIVIDRLNDGIMFNGNIDCGTF